MFSIVMPLSFKIGDTQSVRVNNRATTLFWREKGTLVLNGTDARKILLEFEDGGFRHFTCTDSDGTPMRVDVCVEEGGVRIIPR